MGNRFARSSAEVIFMSSHYPPLGKTAPLAGPLYQSAVYTIPDLDALDRIYNAEEPGFIYARDAHPNSLALAGLLAKAEAADWSVVTSSGMASISAIVLATVSQGQRIVASNRLYGRTTQLFSQDLQRFGVATDFVDACDLKQVERSLAAGAKLLFVETISNPLLRVVDLESLANLAHKHDALLVVDNTFATPVLCRPLEWGADLVMESLTKMIAGHSDVTLGVVAGTGDELYAQLKSTSSIWGFSANPFDCWLAERGLETMTLRANAACGNALVLADWLAEQSGVSRVVYPGRPDHPDHVLAGELLDGQFGHMLCFELAGRDAVNRFIQNARGIPFSPSLGHTKTTLSYPAGTSHRYAPEAEKKKQGITDGLIRLSVGIEELRDIQEAIRQGLTTSV
jgi:cystathionine gamma-synthase